MDFLIYTGTALAGGLVVCLFSDVLQRRRKRKAVATARAALLAGLRGAAAAAVTEPRGGRCTPAEAAQPFVAGCMSGCGWHQHEATDALAAAAARKHADSERHTVAWGSAEELKA